ncbi:MAG: TrmO family methyltransferase, partial [Candidatus Sericytochromatia bacterium]
MADDDWGRVESEIVLDEALPEDALAGLEDFSHLEIVYLFHRVAADQLVTGAEHPRENPAWPKVGIFAQRKKNRPNRLGLTTVELL